MTSNKNMPILTVEVFFEDEFAIGQIKFNGICLYEQCQPTQLQTFGKAHTDLSELLNKLINSTIVSSYELRSLIERLDRNKLK